MSRARVLESLGQFGISAAVDAGNELVPQRCFRFENLKYRDLVVANLKTGYEKPNSQHLLAEQ